MATRRDINTGGRRVTVIEDDVPTVAERNLTAGEEDVVTTYPDGYSTATGFVRMLSMLIGLAFLTVASLLAFRLAFGLAGANPANGFVDFIYDVSAPLVAPFEGIVNEEPAGNGVFEPEVVIALAAYGVATLLVIVFLNIVTAAPRTVPDRSVTTRERHAHYDEEL